MWFAGHTCSVYMIELGCVWQHVQWLLEHYTIYHPTLVCIHICGYVCECKFSDVSVPEMLCLNQCQLSLHPFSNDFNVSICFSSHQASFKTYSKFKRMDPKQYFLTWSIQFIMGEWLCLCYDLLKRSTAAILVKLMLHPLLLEPAHCEGESVAVHIHCKVHYCNSDPEH